MASLNSAKVPTCISLKCHAMLQGQPLRRQLNFPSLVYLESSGIPFRLHKLIIMERPDLEKDDVENKHLQKLRKKAKSKDFGSS